MNDRTDAFREARDFLIAHRTDYATAHRDFKWPRLEKFNWALDWFDEMARGNAQTALRIVGDHGLDLQLSFEAVRRRSNHLAQHLRELGLVRGDRILLMLGNVPSLWTVTLAAMKLGCTVIPVTTLMMAADLEDRITRSKARAVITAEVFADRFSAIDRRTLRLLVNGDGDGWQPLPAEDLGCDSFEPQGATRGSDPLLLYFTSGTTAKPKLVVHTHVSYPIGHLSTLYWLGLRPGDVHLNLSSAGWAKHAWSSFFAPWSAEATVVAMNCARFDAAHLIRELGRCQVTAFCAPPTVWRAIIGQPMQAVNLQLREAVSAGEPLNPRVIAHVQQAWGVTVRDGYGQTETTLQIGNFPGQAVKPGSVGRVAPGYHIELLDAEQQPHAEGEICVSLAEHPVGVMPGYLNDPERTGEVMDGGYYHTGDLAVRDTQGYITYVARNDDVFKSSDYRISPFELESMLLEHAAIVEAAVVPSPDERRLAVPKAFVVLAAGVKPSRELAIAIFRFIRERSSPFKRIRRIEFADLPKTISGKIRRVELRQAELDRSAGRGASGRYANEYWEEDLPELKR